jgi:hypothetical protein
MVAVAVSPMAAVAGTARAVSRIGFCTRGLKVHGASLAMTDA